ncbi:MAG: hypothetical protein M0Q26_13585 [Chitinophagaceae bacterium]|nr:hypothetical protein [Chitinophagaceae bacterium]
MKRLFNFLLMFAILSQFNPGYSQKKSDPGKNGRGGYEYFIGIVGNPSVVADMKWDDKQLEDLKDLGVNMLQLSIAWGGKPANEVLNLEDLNDEQRAKWKFRIKQAEKHGFKTIAQFGIPRMLNYDPVKPACILDPVTREKYVFLIKDFMTTFPEVNDILVYTYDQQAWICSEFGPCPRCTGIPISDRLPDFLNLLKKTMQDCRSEVQTTLWWKPWELSKGQTIDILKKTDTHGFGLMLNSSTSNEVYPFNDGSLKSDLGVKRLVQYAYENNIPVIGEFDHTLYKPLYQIDDFFPRLIYEQMAGWKEMIGVVGVKEYYGFAPSTYSVNYAMLKAWMKAPDASLDELLRQIAAPYGKKSAPLMIKAWEYVAQAVESYPWDVTYLIGPMGLDRNDKGKHSWDFVKIENSTWDTPIWEASRRANFMLTDAKTAHPWIFEDAGLRLEDAAQLFFKAVEYFNQATAENEGMVEDINMQRDFIRHTARSLKGKGLHFALTIAAQDARTMQYDQVQFEKISARIKHLLQEDVDNGYELAAVKLEEFNKDPKTWLKRNFSPLTWKSEADPDWSKWITPQR